MYKQTGGWTAGHIITVLLCLGLERMIAGLLLQNCHFLLEFKQAVHSFWENPESTESTCTAETYQCLWWSHTTGVVILSYLEVYLIYEGHAFDNGLV